MHYLSANDLLNLATPLALIAATEQALRDFAAGQVIAPTRGHLDFEGNTLLTMPVIGKDAFGAKLVSVIPSNAARALPVTNGLMMLFDRHTGAPAAVLNAAALTAQRTGAVGAVGIKHTTPHDLSRIGIIGTGVQGTWQAIYACAVRPIVDIYFLARTDERARAFTDAVQHRAPAVRLIRCADAHDVLEQSQLVITATSSTEPVLPNDRTLLQGKHFISIGSFKPSMQELPDTVYQLAETVIIDSHAARHEVGDLVRPLNSGALSEHNIVHLADLVIGKRALNIARTTAFKSVGMALYDLYAACMLLHEALRLRLGTRLD